MQSEKGSATGPVALFGVSPNRWCGRFHSRFGAPGRVLAARRRDADESGRNDRARVPGRGLVYRDERFPTGVVTPTVVEPPGRLRKEPARKGGRQTFDRRNTNGQ